MFGSLLLFLLGFLFLIIGSRWLIAGASSLAKYFNISEWAIGIIIVGIGTSIPEFAISLASVWTGDTVGMGAVIGSNTFNILVILGLSAMISPLVIYREWLSRDFTINLLSIGMATIFIFLPILGPRDFFGVTYEEGGVLFVMFLTWIIYTIMRKPEQEEKTDYKVFTFFTSFILVMVGIGGVFFGGQWIVDGAEVLARTFGVSEYIIGLTIVGIGTSVPELFVSLTAALRHNASLAVGNVIGSSIFNFFGIFGSVAILGGGWGAPVRAELDILVTFLASGLLFLIIFLGRKNILARWEGVVFILLYIGYIGYLI